MKVTCPKCGKEIEKRGLLNHVKYCEVEPEQYGYIYVEQLLSRAQEPQQVSLPLSVCPPELAYLQTNRQLFLQVAGRKLGDKFVVEEVKMLRR